MTKRWLMLVWMVGVLALSGCLFSVNHPVVAPDGTLALFLDENGGYALFPELGTLNLLQDGQRAPVPAATLSDGGGPFASSPDGLELLYVDIRSQGFLELPESILSRVELRPDAVPEIVWETNATVLAAEWTAEDRILLLVLDGDGPVTLLNLDLPTGETETLIEDLIGTIPFHDGKTRLVMRPQRPDPDTPPATAIVERWDPTTDQRETVMSFILHDQTVETFLTLPQSFLWDVSPDGRWLAVALFDGTIVDPPTEAELPGLYLVDLDLGVSERIAHEALMPAFAPSGEGFTYMRAAEDGSGEVIWQSVVSDESMPVPGGKGASTAFWLAPGRLGMTFEAYGDVVRLVELDTETGELRELLGAPEPEE